MPSLGITCGRIVVAELPVIGYCLTPCPYRCSARTPEAAEIALRDHVRYVHGREMVN